MSANIICGRRSVTSLPLISFKFALRNTRVNNELNHKHYG